MEYLESTATQELFRVAKDLICSEFNGQKFVRRLQSCDDSGCPGVHSPIEKELSKRITLVDVVEP